MKIIKENKWLIIFFLVLLSGAFFLRFYKHHDWLYFKMDQARDASMISESVLHGPSNLPLLGPRAGATEVQNGFLRLGPAFYYFQYAAGFLFNSTSPDVLAYPELFFSLATIVILYFFLRLYFSQKNALLITTMYAGSFIVIQYSRFAWNPNSLPFFTILGFWSLLKFLKTSDVRKKCAWLALGAVALAIGSQLHFFGFFALTGIAGLVVLFHFAVWKKETWLAFFQKKNLSLFALYAAVFLGFFALIYAPVIISDILKKGENTQNFLYAIGSKPEDKPFLDKIFKNTFEQIKYFNLLFTSVYYTDSIKNHWPSVLATLLTLVAGTFFGLRNLLKKTEQTHRDFIFLCLAWLVVFVVLSVPFAFQLRPRFFILVFAVPFIFLGFSFEFLENKFKAKIVWPVIFLLTAIVLALNGQGIWAWFQEQAQSQVKSTAVKRTLILKNKDGVTLGQLERATEHMYALRQGKSNLYYYVKPEHVSPIKYLFEQKKDASLHVFSLKINGDPQAQYFAIVPAKNGTKNIEAKFGDAFTVLSREQFGQLAVYELEFKKRTIDPNFRIKNDNRDTGARIYWKDLFKNDK